MKKAFNFLAILFCTVLFGLTGCGDIYANMRITTNVQSNVLEIVLDPSDPSTFSTTFAATVEGYSEGMDKRVEFEFAPQGVVTAEVLSESNGVNTIRVTAIADANNMPVSNTTTMTIVSRENSKIKSQPITVNLRLPATSLSMREDATPHVVIGGDALLLEPEKLLNFEPFHTTERDVEFTLANQYQGIELAKDTQNGLYKLIAHKTDADKGTPGALWGVVKLVATVKIPTNDTVDAGQDNGAGTDDDPQVVSCPVYVLVHNQVSAEDILVLHEDGSPVDQNGFVMATSIAALSKQNFYVDFDAESGISMNEYQISASVANTTIANVFSLQDRDEDLYYELNAFDIGQTTLDISVSLMGMASDTDINKQKEYYTITKTIPIIVEQKAYDVLLSQGNLDPTGQPLDIKVLHETALTGTTGTQVNVVVLPASVENKNYKIALHNPLAKDGTSLDANEVLEDVIIQQYVGGQLQRMEIGIAEMVEGELVFSGGESLTQNKFYVHYTGTRIGKSFELYIVSESSGVYNQILCNVSSSATDISVLVNGELIKEGEDKFINLGQYVSDADTYPSTIDVMVEYLSSIEGTRVDPRAFNISIKNPEILECIATREQTGNPVYTLRGLLQGSTTITISCNADYGGISRTFAVNVLIPTKSAEITDTVLSGKVTDRHIKSDGDQYLRMITTTKLDINLSTNPTSSTIEAINFELSGVGQKHNSLILDTFANSYVLYAGKSSNQNIIPILDGDNVLLICNYTYWEYSVDDNVWHKHNDGRIAMQIVTFIPVENFTWADSKLTKNITIYNKNSVSQDNYKTYAEASATAMVKSFTSDKSNVQYDLLCEEDKFTFYPSSLSASTMHLTDNKSYNLYIQRSRDYNGEIVFTFYGTLGVRFKYISESGQYFIQNQQSGEKFAVTSTGTISQFEMYGKTYTIQGKIIRDSQDRALTCIGSDNQFELSITDNVIVNVSLTVVQEKLSFPITCNVTILEPTPISEIEISELTTESGTVTLSPLISNSMHLELNGIQPESRMLHYTALPTNVIDDRLSVMVSNGADSYVLANGSTVNDYLSFSEYYIRTDRLYQGLVVTAKKTTKNINLRILPTISLKFAEAGNWELVNYTSITITVADGTEDNPFHITSSSDLVKLSQISNDTNAEQLDKYYILSNSIDMTPVKDWKSIQLFKGTMDFNGFDISGLRYVNADNFGLFRTLDSATLYSVNLRLLTPNGIDVEADTKLGLLAGQISNSTIQGANIALHYSYDKINLGITTSNCTIYFGGLAGYCEALTLSNINISVSTEFVLQSDQLANITLYAGGVAGMFNGVCTIDGGIQGQALSHTTLNYVETHFTSNVYTGTLAGSIGGVVGEISKNPSTVLRNLIVSGSITMPIMSSVGGVVGGNDSAEINNCESSVRVYGLNNVGGIVGKSIDGKIYDCVVESYNSDTMLAENIYAVRGNQYVGGLVGYAKNTKIQFSFILSYIKNRTMTDQSSAISGVNTFYGDVVGSKHVGGIAGYALDTTIEQSFASCQINAKDMTTDTYTAYVGGIIGESNGTEIQYSFANATILTNIPASNTLCAGQLIGYMNNATTINEVYARVILNTYTISDGIMDITRSYQPYLGTTTDGYINEVYYYIHEGTPDLFTNIDPDATDTLKPLLEEFDLTKWISADNDLVAGKGYNDNSLLLYDRDRGILYKESITDIKINNIHTDTSDNTTLPEYFAYGSGLVVNLDKLYTQTQGEYNDLTLSDLIDIQFSPSSITYYNCKVNFYSTDTSIIDVIRDNNDTLEGARLKFTGKTGVVTIVIQSKQNLSIRVHLEINVIPGLSQISYEDSRGNDLTSGMHYLKLDNQFTINPVVTNNLGSTHMLGITYYTSHTDYIKFINGNWVDNKINLTILNTTHNLLGLVITQSNTVQMTAMPYLILTFGGSTTLVPISDLNARYTPQIIQFKIYQGITHSFIDTDKTTIYSSDSFDLDINYITGNADCVELHMPNGTSSQIYDYNQQYSIEFTDGNNNTAHLRYIVTQSKDDGKFSIHFELEENSRYIVDNQSFDFAFILYDNLARQQYCVYNFTITFCATPVNTLSAKFYQNGTAGFLQNDAPNNVIVPGREGMLQINVSHYYSVFDEIRLTSSMDPVTGDSISFGQLLYTGRTGAGVETFVTHSSEVNSIERITGRVEDDPYYNGTLYVSTIVNIGVPEDTIFNVTITPYYMGEMGRPITITLVSSFVSHATLTPTVDTETLVIAKGGTLELNLSGTIQNSKVQISIEPNNSQFSLYNVAEDKKELYTTIQDSTGQKFSFNIPLVLYAELDAMANDNGQILIKLEIKPTNFGLSSAVEYSRTIVVNLVDYLVDSYSIVDADNGTLTLYLVQNKKLCVEQKIVLPKYEDYITYSSSGKTSILQSKFEELPDYINIKNKAESNITTLNAWGTEVGESSFYCYREGVYTSINSRTTGLDIVLSTEQSTVSGQKYLVAKGRVITNNINMKSEFYTGYTYNGTTKSFEYKITNTQENDAILSQFNSIPFVVNIVNTSTEDNPYLIEDTYDLMEMEAGVNYILTCDLTLENWQPLTTAIASLDGNGYVLTIKSFATISGNAEVNIGLFDTVATNTLLKNIIIDVSSLSFVNALGHSSVNFGLIAGQNLGTIYNCDVIVTAKKSDTYLNMKNSDSGLINNKTKLSKFAQDSIDSWIKGNECPASIAIASDTTINNTTLVTTNTGGLVGYNKGSITHSRVGSLKGVGYNQVHNSNNKGSQGINILSGGNLGGLVGYNDGIISASYYANGTLLNSWDTQKISNGNTTIISRTAGVVAQQSVTGRVNGCYVQGNANNSIMSYGSIGGFVHTNAGLVEDCYAIIPLHSPNGAGGFVYINSGKIYSSYTQCTITNNNLANGVFTGVDTGTIEANNTGIIDSCYYLYDANNAQDTNVVINETESAIKLSSQQFGTTDYFYGFTFNDIWKMGEDRPQLIEADNITYYNRKVEIKSKEEAPDFSYHTDHMLGSKSAPYIIHNLDSWNRVFKNSDEDQYIRIINDIDFLSANSDVTSKKTFEELDIYGNGMRILNLKATISDEDQSRARSTDTITTNYGLFAEVSKCKITNLEIVVDEELIANSRSVGALAGTINASIIENIRINSVSTTSIAEIQGLNAVGGLAGIVGEKSLIFDIQSSVSTYAKFQSSSVSEPLWNGYDKLDRISYTGGIIGILDNGNNIDINQATDLIVTGDIDIMGENAGGVIGYLGIDNTLTNAEFILATGTTPTIRATHFAGGIVAENNGGTIKGASVALELEEQNQLDITARDSITTDGTVPTALGYLDLFADDDKVVAIGGLVGLMSGGKISDAYTRVGVVSDNAYIAGGLVGLLVSNSDSAYIISLLDGKEPIKEVLDDNVDIKPESGNVNINYCYTTSPVQSSFITGGMVGMVRNVILNVDTEPHLAIINNHTPTIINQIINDSNDVEDIPEMHIGSAVGYLIGNGDGFIFIGDQDTSTTDFYLTQSPLYNNNNVEEMRSVGKSISAELTDNVSNPTTFYDSLNGTINPSFKTNSWDINTYLLPILRAGVDYIVTEASNFEELCAALNIADASTKITLTEDIDITWADDIPGNKSLSEWLRKDKPLSGTISAPEMETKTITINLSSEDSFQSLFGIVDNFSLNNINVIFNITGNMTLNLDKFAFISHYARSLNISGDITIKSDTDRSITIKASSDEAYYYGIIAGEAHTALSISNTNVTMEKVTLQFDTTATPTTPTYIGGIAGYMNGIPRIKNTTINIPSITATTSNTTYFGGAFGCVDNSSNGGIENITLQATLDLTNNQQNYNYMGGVIGKLDSNLRLNTITTSGSISVTASNNIYLGGIMGASLSTTDIAQIASGMGITLTTNNGIGDIYVGGIAGQLNINLGENKSSIFASLLSTGNISVEASNLITNAYLGGLYGMVKSNREDLLISGVALNDIKFLNTNNTNRLDIGGLVGYMHNAKLVNSLSNAYINAASEVDTQSVNSPIFNIGGIVGYMDTGSNLDTVNTVTTIDVANNILSSTANKYIDPVVGYKEDNSILNVVYAPTLSGRYTKVTGITQNDDFTLLINGDGDSFLMPYNENYNHTQFNSDLSNYLSNCPQMKVHKITSITNLDTAINNLGDAQYKGSTILLNLNDNDKTITTFDNDRVLSNIRRLVGVNGTTIVGNNAITISASRNTAFFDEISSGVLVSNININIASLTINSATENSNVAIFVAQNNGTIFGCSVGAIPVQEVSTDTVNNFSANLTANAGSQTARYTGVITDYVTNNVSTILYNASTNANISAICANNAGTISTSHTYADIICKGDSTTASNVGLIAGNASNANMLDNFAMGRITYYKTVSSDNVGGLLGNANNTIMNTSISVVNIYLSSNVDAEPASAGLVVGRAEGSSFENIIANSTISMAHVDKLNTTGATPKTTKDMSMQQAKESVLDEFNQKIWAQNNETNFGYPYLQLNMSTTSTGNGEDSSPFMITEAEQFSISSDNGDNYVLLVRDVVYYGGISMPNVNRTFNGNGNVILVDNVNTNSSDSAIFHTLNADVHSLVVVYHKAISLEAESVNFGGLAINANSTTISKVAVVGINADSYNVAITNNTDGEMGGIVASTTGEVTIQNCWTDLDITADVGSLGGLVASTSSETIITQCFSASSMALNGTSDNNYLGRLVGNSNENTIIEYSYYFEKYTSGDGSTFASHYSLTGNINNNLSVAKVSYCYMYTPQDTSSDSKLHYYLNNNVCYTAVKLYGNWFASVNVDDKNPIFKEINESDTLPYLTNTTPVDYKIINSVKPD